MKLRVYVPELNGEQAYALMEKEGQHHVIKDSDRFGHIWLDGYTSTWGVEMFAPDRNPVSSWADSYGGKGWVGLAARGWRSPKGSGIFTRVTLLFVGEDAIKATTEREQRKLYLQAGVWHVWPYGVPKRTEPTTKSEPNLTTIAYLEQLKTVEERWKILNRTKAGYGDWAEWEEPEEFDTWGVKGWVDHDHITALLPKTGLATFKEAMAKQGISYEEMTLNDLERTAVSEDEEAYVKPGAKVAYRCEYIDTGLRAWYPRFIRAKYATGVKVHYPDRSAPIVVYTEDQPWFLVAAPYITEA